MITKTAIVEIADVLKKIPVYDMRGNKVENWKAESLQSLNYINMDPYDVVCAFADYLAAQNPKFNRELFIRYINGECGPNGGKA